MNYDAEFSSVAAVEIRRLPPPLRRAVRRRIEAICDDPVGLSRPAIPPREPPGYQVVRCFEQHEDVFYYFVVAFKYLQNEKTLLIHGIGREGPVEDGEPF